MNGDILTQLNFKEMFDYAIKKDSMLTVGIKEYLMPFSFGNVFCDGDFITGIEEKPDIRHKILAGIYILKPEILGLIPEDEYYGMDSLILKMIGENIPITKYEIQEYWLDIGQVSDYKKAQEVYYEHYDLWSN